MNRMADGSNDRDAARRRLWMGILARSSTARLEQSWEALTDKPAYRMLRTPQVGLAMVRGRIGGTGEAFNLGEMTMTRAAVQVAGKDGMVATGYGYVAGRDMRHAELAALFDALLQEPHRHMQLLEQVIEPLAAELAAARTKKAGQVGPSKVEFFTLVRGD